MKVALVLTSVALFACGHTASPRPSAPAAALDNTWTETPLDDVVAELKGCHIRSETRDGNKVRIRERWEGPEWSFTLARVDARTIQARLRVTRGSSELEAFSSLPDALAIEAHQILALLTHPGRPNLPSSSTLVRLFRQEHDGLLTIREEFGSPAYRGRSITRERNDGETFELQTDRDDSSVRSRAWLDERGRHVEIRGRGGAMRTALEERDEDGRVVAEHYSITAHGETRQYTARYAYDERGRLIAAEEMPIEVTDAGETTTTCVGFVCVTRDSEGRVIAEGPPGSESTMTIHRDDQGRVVEVHDARFRNTTTIRRNPAGQRTGVVSARYAITGEWEDDRLMRTSTRTLREGQMVEAATLTRTYDAHGRLSSSIVEELPTTPEMPVRRSEMRVSYTECDASAEVVLEPAHVSLLESAFELIE